MKIVDEGVDRTGLRGLLNRMEQRLEVTECNVDGLAEAVVSLSESLDSIARSLAVLAGEQQKEVAL